MSSSSIGVLGMPKWGMSMSEGRLVEWLVEEGSDLGQGDDVAEVETEKINGVVEATSAGILRRRVAAVGEVIPVGGLLGVIADTSVPDKEIESFIAEFQANFVPEAEGEEGGQAPRTITLGTRRINYLKMGEGGEVLLLLHGFGGDLNSWLFNVSALAGEERSVYALDLPGHGGSTKDVGTGNLADFVQTLADFADAAGLDRMHLAGHSMGGAVAIAFALAHPNRVASVILIGSAGLGPEINADYIEGFIAASSRRELEPVLQLLFSDPNLVTRQLIDDALKYKRLDGVDDALRTVARQICVGGSQATLLAPELSGASFPILAIWGRNDQIIPVAHAGVLPTRARIEVLTGKGHCPHMEAAGEVNRLIVEFIDGL